MRQVQEREKIVQIKFNNQFKTENISDYKYNFTRAYWDNKKNNKSKSNFSCLFSVFLKITKILLYSFLMLMGLWGCFQTMAEPEVKSQLAMGSGLEFGYLFGTNDNRYLLGKSSGEYYVFSINEWTLKYGPFYGFFVWPGASLVLEIMYNLRDAWGGFNALLAILILVFIIRTLTLLISLKSITSQERMQEIQPKIAEVRAKYKSLKDMESKRLQQLEINNIYRKYNVKPFAMFEQVFITLPIFLVIYRVITIIRPLKSTLLFNIWNFSKVPMQEIFSNFSGKDGEVGGWVYIFFLLLIIPIQMLSQKLPQILSKKRTEKSFVSTNKAQSEMKKMKIIQIVLMVVLAFVVISSASGVGIYWGLSSLFSIGQTLFVHWLLTSKSKKSKNSSYFFKEIGIG
ncbi:MAG: membrane protein insertase YidC [Mycoplasmoidaceae bacterium]